MKKLISIICAFSFVAMPILAEEAPKQEQKSPAPAQSKLPEYFKKRILKQFDKDNDGFLNETELAEAKASLKERRKRFEDMQKKHAKRILQEFDKDGDGKLSLDELVPLIEKQRRMFAEMASRRPNRPTPRVNVQGEMPQGKDAVGVPPPPPPPPSADGKTPPPPPNEFAPRQGKQGRFDGHTRPDRPRFRYPMPDDLDELKKAE